jgi:hypothetical protein
MAQRLSGGLQQAKSGSDAIWAKPGIFNTQIMPPDPGSKAMRVVAAVSATGTFLAEVEPMEFVFHRLTDEALATGCTGSAWKTKPLWVGRQP